jgi:predicted transcriptional regulator YdeE
MNPKIITEKEWLVVGMSFYGDPFNKASGWSEDNEIGILWKRFMAFIQKNSAAISGAIKHAVDPGAALEIHVYTEETVEKGIFEVFVGARVEKLEDVPVECVVKALPATQYAVFTIKGEQITSDWGKMIYHDWLPSSGYCESHKYHIQYYDQRFKGLDKIEESTLDVYVPVKRVER